MDSSDKERGFVFLVQYNAIAKRLANENAAFFKSDRNFAAAV